MLNKNISLCTQAFKFLCEQGKTPDWSPLELIRTDISDVKELRVSFKENPLTNYNINILCHAINHELKPLMEMEEKALCWAQEQTLYPESKFHILKNIGVTGLCITAYPNFQLNVYSYSKMGT